MNLFYRVLLTFNATFLLVIMFLAQQNYALGYFFPEFRYLSQIPDIASYFIYLLIPAGLTWFSIYLCQHLGEDSFDEGYVVSIRNANNSFLPSYLGYFFVGLTIDGCGTLLFVYIVLSLFTFLSQALYFNPLFLVFGFRFYNIITQEGASVFLISRTEYKLPCDVVIAKANRINDYTFIDRG